jgi:branched-chain amino acid aminotransferase
MVSAETPPSVTPPLDGTILTGVTRDALIQLAGADGHLVKEEPISIADWRDGCAAGDITEVFACGTAAGVTPVGSVLTSTDSWTVGQGIAGPVTLRLRDLLWKAQRGLILDQFGWLVPA